MIYANKKEVYEELLHFKIKRRMNENAQSMRDLRAKLLYMQKKKIIFRRG